jgi:hypothetical protein
MVLVPPLGFIITGALLVTIDSDTTLRVVLTPIAVRREKWRCTRRAAILEATDSQPPEPLSGLSRWLIVAPWQEREIQRLG